MTTTIRVTTNGSYVSEGKLISTVNGSDVSNEQTVSVGPGSMVFKDFTVPHNSTVTLELSERQATTEEIEKAAQARVDGATAGG